jgi:hypothetical protein
MTNERNETKSHDRVAVVVFVILAANAATAFAIQAWMTYGFAKDVWHLPTQLCFALIVALDIFAIMYMVLTYLLRGTGWPRFAATVVFLFSIGAQVFAAELYGDHEDWSTEVRWFAVFPALALALSQEGVILWRTHRNDALGKRAGDLAKVPAAAPPKQAEPARKPSGAQVPERAPAPAATVEPARKERPESGKTQVKAPAKVRKDDGKSARRRALVEDIIAKRMTTEDVAKAEDVSLRSVQLWVKAHQGRHPEPATRFFPATLDTDVTSTNVAPINGNSPEVSVN